MAEKKQQQTVNEWYLKKGKQIAGPFKSMTDAFIYRRNAGILDDWQIVAKKDLKR